MHFASGGRAAPQQLDGATPASAAQWALEIIESMRSMGAPDDELLRFGAQHGVPGQRVQAHLAELAAKGQAGETPAAVYGVWAPNWHAVSVLCAMANQWHVHFAPSGHMVRSGLNLAGWPRDWAQLVRAELRQPLNTLRAQMRSIESAALGWWAEELSALAARR